MADYEIENRETVAEAPGLRVRILTLAQWQCVPWHYHSAITDTFFCMEGPMLVQTRAPGPIIPCNPAKAAPCRQ